MKATTFKLTLLAVIATLPIFAQVGIGTSTPEVSSVLDITATDKGILIPRISLDNVATTQLDGVNTAATGLLIWNTNAATTNGSGVGFYYFDGTTWIHLTNGTTDVDWYEQGTTNAPNAITDNIFTNGAVGINAAASSFRQLNVDANNLASEAGYFSNATSSSGTKTGIRIAVTSNTNASKYGVYNSLGSIDNSGILYATYNRLFGANNEGRYGMYNQFTGSGAGTNYGVYSEMNPSATGNIWGAFNNIVNDNSGDKVGVQNSLTGAGGRNYGTVNDITANGTLVSYGTFNTSGGTGTGAKYGSYNLVDPAAGGTHFGIYSEVLKPASFAGYFRGDVAIGTTAVTSGAPDFYILPPARGTANQIMQIDGAGDVSWVDNTSLIDAENGLTETTSVVRLGGPLTQDSTISNGGFNFDINLTGLGDFHIQDNGVNHFSVESTGDSNFGSDVFWNDGSTTGTRLAALTDNGDDGQFRIYENGSAAIDLNASGTSVFNQQGLDRDFRIESDTNPNAFGVDASADIMYAGTPTVGLPNNGATINGATVDYVASFYTPNLTNGTAVQFGSTEYIMDSGNLQMSVYGSWLPYYPMSPTAPFTLGNAAQRWSSVWAINGTIQTSDIRLKKNIRSLEYGLDEILRINPITYQWKDETDTANKIGFSAEELLKIIPEVVVTHSLELDKEDGAAVRKKNEHLGVYYSDIIPVLTKAIQEQQALILRLEERINTLEKKN